MKLLSKKEDQRPKLETVLMSLENIAPKNKFTVKFLAAGQKSKPNKLVQSKRRKEK